LKKYEKSFQGLNRRVSLSSDNVVFGANIFIEYIDFSSGEIKIYFKNKNTAGVQIYESKIASIRILNKTAKSFMAIDKAKEGGYELFPEGYFDFEIEFKNKSMLYVGKS